MYFWVLSVYHLIPVLSGPANRSSLQSTQEETDIHKVEEQNNRVKGKGELTTRFPT